MCTRVLIIEDDITLARLLREYLMRDSEDYDVEVAVTLQGAMAKVRQRPPDVITLDLKLPDSGPRETAAMIGAFTKYAPVIVITGVSNDPDLDRLCADNGASRILLKFQLRVEELRAVITRDIGVWRTRKKLRDSLA